MFANTAIFQFELPGIGSRFADPLAVRRRLLAASEGRLWEWAAEARRLQQAVAGVAGDGETERAERAAWSAKLAQIEGLMVAAAYPAFDGFTPVDPETGYGITEAVALGVLQAYLGWLEEKKGESGTSA